jgi:hypothetical protein
MATAFYTSAKNVIVIINPSNVNYTQVQVRANNVGSGFTKGTVYLLNNANRNITSSSLALSLVGTNSYTGRVDLPAYSVVAITVTP